VDFQKPLRKPLKWANFENQRKKGNNMVTKLVNQPLGMGIPYAPNRKEWVTAALAGASLAAGIGSSIFGGVQASKAAREAERRQRAAEAREDAWYNRRYYEDYADTAAGQNLIRRAKDIYANGIKRAEGAAAVAGGTDAAKAMAKEAGNKAVADTIANVAATDTQRKDNVDNMHRQAQEKFMQMDMAREQQRANAITQAAQGASNALMSAAGTLGQEQALKGASNNSTPAPSTTTTATSTPSATHVGGKIVDYDLNGNPIYSNMQGA
jgi:hypothetical protein